MLMMGLKEGFMSLHIHRGYVHTYTSTRTCTWSWSWCTSWSWSWWSRLSGNWLPSGLIISLPGSFVLSPPNHTWYLSFGSQVLHQKKFNTKKLRKSWIFLQYWITFLTGRYFVYFVHCAVNIVQYKYTYSIISWPSFGSNILFTEICLAYSFWTKFHTFPPLLKNQRPLCLNLISYVKTKVKVLALSLCEKVWEKFRNFIYSFLCRTIPIETIVILPNSKFRKD